MVAWWPPDTTITNDSAAKNNGEQIGHSCWGNAHLDIYTSTAKWICACGGVYSWYSDIFLYSAATTWWTCTDIGGYIGCIYGLSISIQTTIYMSLWTGSKLALPSVDLFHLSWWSMWNRWYNHGTTIPHMSLWSGSKLALPSVDLFHLPWWIMWADGTTIH